MAGPVSQKEYDALILEVASISAKRRDDDKHFNLNSNGRLYLVDRPYSCWAQMCEWLTRLFTNKLPNLERKFLDVTLQVEQYLKREQDEERVSQFLNTYTSSINELYHCAGRMKAAARIALAPRATDNKQTEELVLAGPYQNGGYSNTDAGVTFRNEDIYPVQFRLISDTGYYGWEHAITKDLFNRHQERSAKAVAKLVNDVYQVEAKQLYETDVWTPGQVAKDATVTLDSSGVFTHSCGPAASPDESRFTFINKFNKPFSVDAINGLDQCDQTTYNIDGQRPTVQPGRTVVHRVTKAEVERTIKIKKMIHRDMSHIASQRKDQAEGVDFSITKFQIKTSITQTADMHLGCKVGKYKCLMDSLGNLQVVATAKRIKKVQELGFALPQRGPVVIYPFDLTREDGKEEKAKKAEAADVRRVVVMENRGVTPLRVSLRDEQNLVRSVTHIGVGQKASVSFEELIESMGACNEVAHKATVEAWKNGDMRLVATFDEYLPIAQPAEAARQ